MFRPQNCRKHRDFWTRSTDALAFPKKIHAAIFLRTALRTVLINPLPNEFGAKHSEKLFSSLPIPPVCLI